MICIFVIKPKWILYAFDSLTTQRIYHSAMNWYNCHSNIVLTLMLSWFFESFAIINNILLTQITDNLIHRMHCCTVLTIYCNTVWVTKPVWLLRKWIILSRVCICWNSFFIHNTSTWSYSDSVVIFCSNYVQFYIFKWIRNILKQINNVEKVITSGLSCL